MLNLFYHTKDMKINTQRREAYPPLLKQGDDRSKKHESAKSFHSVIQLFNYSVIQLLRYSVILLSLAAINASAQTWQIGSPNAADVIATLEDGTLTISGTGAMQDWSAYESPWYNVKK